MGVSAPNVMGSRAHSLIELSVANVPHQMGYKDRYSSSPFCCFCELEASSILHTCYPNLGYLSYGYVGHSLSRTALIKIKDRFSKGCVLDLDHFTAFSEVVVTFEEIYHGYFVDRVKEMTSYNYQDRSALECLFSVFTTDAF